jgi:O-antigen/teichoic acid export membrane protein
MNKIFKNTAIYTAANVVQQAINFLLLPIYSQYLPPEQYGIVAAMHTIQVFIAIFFSFSLEKSIVRMYWDYDKSNRDIYLGTITITVFIISVIALGISMLLKPQLGMIFPNIPVHPYLTIAILLTFVNTISQIPFYYFRLKQMAIQYVAFSIFKMILNALFVLVLIIKYRKEAEGVLLGQLGSNILLAIPLIYVIFKYIPMKYDVAMIKDGVKFSFPMIPTFLAAWVINQWDRTMIANNLSMADVGIYSMAKKIASVIGIVNMGFMMAYRPIFFELASAGNRYVNNMKKHYTLYIIALMAVGFMMLVCTEYLFRYFINVSYISALTYIPYMVIAVFLSAVSSTVLGSYLYQNKKIHIEMAVAIFSAVLYVILLYLTIDPLGLTGVVLSYLVSIILIFYLNYLYTCRGSFFIPFDWDILIWSTFTFVIAFIAIRIIPTPSILIRLMKDVLIVIVALGSVYLRLIQKAEYVFLAIGNMKKK